jgi:hypothetical protein
VPLVVVGLLLPLRDLSQSGWALAFAASGLLLQSLGHWYEGRRSRMGMAGWLAAPLVRRPAGPARPGTGTAELARGGGQRRPAPGCATWRPARAERAGTERLHTAAQRLCSQGAWPATIARAQAEVQIVAWPALGMARGLHESTPPVLQARRQAHGQIGPRHAPPRRWPRWCRSCAPGCRSTRPGGVQAQHELALVGRSHAGPRRGVRSCGGL